MTPLKMIPSAGIREALIATGDHYALKLGTYEHPKHVGNADWRVTLWMLPCGEWVLETNGDPIFETDSADDFDAIMAEYGIHAEAAR